MRRTLTSLFIASTLISFGQSTDEDTVRNKVDEFFTAFHAQDSAGLANLVSEKIVLQTIGTGKDGETILRQENFEDLIRSIISIPDSVKFREKLLDYSIQIDGAMANAWTPYEFWVNDTFSHCGVNSFQMVKQQGVWKIIYLIDTRRREGCEGQPD
ncbi:MULTISPECIES: nuclear transport factor 2 family protein [Maribacter]|uniref:Nuclear transport factor 2 family protein n=1 Tax=Maribacter flavus TaxID=1658664 RepID=A0ABU7II96_9FLAO|nr:MULTISPECIES: nuclear transport factor 2 family protein [Maribacter]MDC6405575.1 nuclear transport factor 2 family protein [Maribacter sp. PR66]MEE1972657.1 nuclear transport factor 2 family protein [Maribacter flavus]